METLVDVILGGIEGPLLFFVLAVFAWVIPWDKIGEKVASSRVVHIVLAALVAAILWAAILGVMSFLNHLVH
ncbi:MAG: hypothetical protein ABSB82_20135 [Terriglobia bacterium]|jgi:hypothetical protein